MYLVLTDQNARDTTVASLAPRLITDDAEKALEAARIIQKNYQETPFVSRIIIYDLNPNSVYTLHDFCQAVRREDGNGLIVYISRKSWDNKNVWVEKFFGVFERFVTTTTKPTPTSARCVSGGCGHGHAGDPPDDFGGRDFD